MRDTVVLTVIGSDRTGLVESLAERISAHGGSWEASHMARLAGQFAGILLVTIDRDRVDALIRQLRELDGHGLHVVVRPSEPGDATHGAPVQLALTGDDRPGIVRDVARVLAARGVNVEELESRVESATMSGEALFVARARLRVPPQLPLAELRRSLEALAGELMVDLTFAETLG